MKHSKRKQSHSAPAISTVLMAALLSLVGCVGCGGSSGSGSQTVSTPVSVTITGAGQVRAGGTAQLVATVLNSQNTAVTWQVNGTAGGTSASGTISVTGLYTAPGVLPSPNPVSITAVSQASSSASATVTETVLTPIPVITSGTATQQNSTTLFFDVLGSNFVQGSQIQVTGAASVTTTYVSATELQATVMPYGASSAIIDVLNPNPGSSASNSLTLTIQSTLATTYTVTAPRLTMHVGDPVPPCVIEVLQGATSVGEGSALFSGAASCTIGATSTSSVGTYPITVSGGSLVPTSSNSQIRVVNSTINVIASDGVGAALNNSNPYPSGFLTGPAFPMLNVTSNPICNMVPDGLTDNTVCMQNLLAYGGFRAKAGAMVSTSGITVSANASSNGNLVFTTIPANTQIFINGAPYIVASVSSATTLTLKTSAGNQPDALLTVPTTVNTSGTTITATNGISFLGMSGTVLVNGVTYTIANVQDAQHITTTSPLPLLTGAAFFYTTYYAGFGRQEMQLYFPAGTYLISASETIFGNYWTMMGDGPQKSVIRLAPNSPQFNNLINVPQLPVLNAVSVNLNDNFRDIFSNLGIDIGPGNPAAQAIQWTSNNMGSMQNVQIWSEDSNAVVGVYVGYSYSGPTLLKNVGIYGFQQGVYTNQVEYNVTLDQITLEGQTAEGCNCGMNLSIQHLLSDNAVTAIADVGRVALIDSELFSNSTNVTGITVAPNDQIYLQNVSCTGYYPCEVDTGLGVLKAVTYNTLPATAWTGAAQSVFDSGIAAGPIALPDTETPLPNDPAVSTWTMLGTDPTTWCSTIANSTSTTVYLPPGVYAASANINCTIPDTVNHIQMYNAHFNQTSSAVLATFNIAGVSTTPLIIDGCMYSACEFNHTGTRTLVLRDTIGGYQASPGAGNVYLEDVGLGTYGTTTTPGSGPTFYAGQLVTARQLDIEVGVSTNIALYPKIQCQGAKLWMLGYKTEQDSPMLIETAKCQADIYGFFFYNLSPAGAGVAPFYATTSSLFATGFFDWNVVGYGDQYWLTETRNGVTQSLAIPAYGTNYGEALNMLYSYGGN